MKYTGYDSDRLRSTWPCCVLTVLAMVWLPVACRGGSDSTTGGSSPSPASGGLWSGLRVVGPAFGTPDTTLRNAADVELREEGEQLSTCLKESGFSAAGVSTTDAQALLPANMALAESDRFLFGAAVGI